jgi:hypothetical protein
LERALNVAKCTGSNVTMVRDGVAGGEKWLLAGQV